MNPLPFVFTVLMSSILSFAASYFFFNKKLDVLLNEIQLRPPILVVDMLGLAGEAVPVGSGQAAVEEHFRNTQEVISKFREAGFLVLPRENIISSPQDLMLDIDDLPAIQSLSKGDKNDEAS